VCTAVQWEPRAEKGDTCAPATHGFEALPPRGPVSRES